MINEEDHLRLQVLVSGLRLREAHQTVDRLDEDLGSQLPFAFHQEFGFLTSCPTNVGTGLRASILIHLPGLVLTKEIGRILQGITQVGLTFRGLYGEGSEVVGNFFQVSNQTTLGKSEEDLVEHLEKMVTRVIQYETRARRVLLRDAPTVIEDKIWRAYGLLRYARSLSFDEVMNLLSGVRLGVSMNLLSGLRVYTLNKIMIYAQSAHLEQAAGRALSDGERDAHRAEYVRRILSEEGDVEPDTPPEHDDD
jgi:protein arginine kinase